jgi:arginine decarboxylase
MPQPKHILIDRDAKGKLKYKLWAPEQKPKDVLVILGYYD